MLQQILRAAEKAETIIVAFSGKDSLACLLLMLEFGFHEKLELWHHLVDDPRDTIFFDWECTKCWIEAIAQHFSIPLYLSFRQGGFRAEMLRENEPTNSVWFQDQKHRWVVRGGNGKPNTRLLFPMPTASLQTRWCSSYLKISVMDTAIRNQERFNHSRTLVLTGERAEESPGRAKYQSFEPHRTDNRIGKSRRWVDHARPVLYWRTQEVWEIIKKYRITAHPAYYLGFGRSSCALCIFLGSKDLRVLLDIMPERVQEVANYESQFGKTIAYDSRRSKKGLPQLDIKERAALGKPRSLDPVWVEQATSDRWFMSIITDPWIAPAGMLGDLSGGSI